MRVRGFCCGWLELDRGLLTEGDSGRIRIPVPVYLIEHAGSIILYDSGLHPDLRSENTEMSRQLSTQFAWDLPDGTLLNERLVQCGVQPDQVDLLIISHLHFDHVGGMDLVDKAQLVIQRAEWHLSRAKVSTMHHVGLDLERKRSKLLLDGRFDALGDGRLVVMPTPGHTAGHQSLHIRLDNGDDLLLCGDACYLRRNLESLLLPGESFDRDAQLLGLQRMQRMEESGTHLIFGHDPEQWPQGIDDDQIIELSGPAPIC